MKEQRTAPQILEIDHVVHEVRSGFWMKRVRILHEVSFAIPAGSIFGLLGENGAGKTSLIQLIVGLREPVQGSIRVFGKSSSSPESRRRIGFMPERPYFYEHLTGKALLGHFGRLSGMSHDELARRIPHVLGQVGLPAGAGDRELRHYSKGMLQRIGIAQAILHDPDLLILDEPMSGLDPLGRKDMRELIVQLASHGKTILFSSHVIPDVEAICDQVAVIRKGKLLGCGAVSTFLSQGKSQTEIGFAGLDSGRVSGIRGLESQRAVPGGWRAQVGDGSSPTAVIRDLIGAGAEILWVTPIRPTLEILFEREGGGA